MKKNLIFVLALLFVIPFCAASTQINVESLAGVDVTISVLEHSDEYNSVQSFYDLPAGDSGNVSAVYDGELDEFDIAVYVKIGGETAYYERFSDFVAGDPIYLQVPKREDAEPPVVDDSEDSEEELSGTEAITNGTNATQDGVTGYVTSESEGKAVNYTYYIIGAVLLVGLAIASFAMKSKIGKGPRPPNNPESSAQKNLPRLSPAPKEDMRSKIEEAERKLKEATSDLENIKKREKIDEAEQKLESDRQELDKMKLDFEQRK